MVDNNNKSFARVLQQWEHDMSTMRNDSYKLNDNNVNDNYVNRWLQNVRSNAERWGRDRIPSDIKKATNDTEDVLAKGGDFISPIFRSSVVSSWMLAVNTFTVSKQARFCIITRPETTTAKLAKAFQKTTWWGSRGTGTNWNLSKSLIGNSMALILQFVPKPCKLVGAGKPSLSTFGAILR